jgi:hypothetical protein
MLDPRPVGGAAHDDLLRSGGQVQIPVKIDEPRHCRVQLLPDRSSSRPLLDLVDVVGDQAVGFPVDVGGGLGRWGLD